MKLTKFFITTAGAAVLFFGPNSAFASDADIKAAIAGKSLVTDTAVFKARRNGRLTGKAGTVVFKGAWTIRDGKWCRTFSEPAEWVGTECQTLVLGDGEVTITGRSGPTVWKLK